MLRAERGEFVRLRDECGIASMLDHRHRVLQRVQRELDLEEAALLREYPVSRQGVSMPACTHLNQIRDVAEPEVTECPACVREGNRYWVQLRQCLICGHVGCCDSSPPRHASHFDDSQHPIVRTLEAGQDWRWCFVDELLV